MRQTSYLRLGKRNSIRSHHPFIFVIIKTVNDSNKLPRKSNYRLIHTKNISILLLSIPAEYARHIAVVDRIDYGGIVRMNTT